VEKARKAAFWWCPRLNFSNEEEPSLAHFALKIRVDRYWPLLRLEFDRRLILEFRESRAKLEA
jgi:hypothetical protein